MATKRHAMTAQAEAAVNLLINRELTIAVGESLTGGLLCSALASVPGSSAVLRGGVVAYQSQVKRKVLEVPAEVLSAGLVTREVAASLARGAQRVMDSDVALGTTGAAGPDPHDGQPPGTAWIALVDRNVVVDARQVHLTGTRHEVRLGVTEVALGQLVEFLMQNP